MAVVGFSYDFLFSEHRHTFKKIESSNNPIFAFRNHSRMVWYGAKTGWV